MQNVCQNSPLQIPQTFIPLDLNEQLVLLSLLVPPYSDLTAIRIKNLIKLRVSRTLKLAHLYTILDKLKTKGLIRVIVQEGTKIYLIEPLGKGILKENLNLVNWMKEGVEL